MSAVKWSREEIDQAWLPARSADNWQWDAERARHLMRRAGFGASQAQIDTLLGQDFDDTLAGLFAPSGADAFDREAEAMIRTSLVLGNSDHVIDWWLYRMRSDPFVVREKAAWMWHGLFCTSRAKVPDARLLLKQNQTLRGGALGSFADLVKAIARDAAMLIYLDSTENSKSHPNENFARELLELFCLGLGNYSERDIRELARCFTGWEVRRQRFRFSPTDHDSGIKEILGARGSFDGDRSIDLVLAQPAAAIHVARRLIRFYVTDGEVPEPVAQGLAETIRGCDWQIEPVLKKLFASRVFFSSRARAQKVASPVQWTLQWLAALETSFDGGELRRGLQAMGCLPLEPPNVKGWPGGTDWVGSARMTARIRWAHRLASDALEPTGGLGVWLASQQLRDATQITAWVEQSLLAGHLATARRQRLRQVVESAGTPENALREAVAAASLLPESHLC